MAKITLVIIIIIARTVLGVALAEFPKDPYPGDPNLEACQHFNDGCNTCFRNEDGTVDCTTAYCEEFHEPVCYDNQ